MHLVVPEVPVHQRCAWFCVFPRNGSFLTWDFRWNEAVTQRAAFCRQQW